MVSNLEFGLRCRARRHRDHRSVVLSRRRINQVRRAHTVAAGFSAAAATCQLRVLAQPLHAGQIARLPGFHGATAQSAPERSAKRCSPGETTPIGASSSTCRRNTSARLSRPSKGTPLTHHAASPRARRGGLGGLGRYKYPSHEGETEKAENDIPSLRIEKNHHGLPRASANPLSRPIARAGSRGM